MKKLISLLLILVLCCAAALAENENAHSFVYEHDPRENPTAMRDIVENPDAVYGFSPSPSEESTLKEYADVIDWTDPEQVGAARAQRQAYHDSMEELYDMTMNMVTDDLDIETIARAVSQRRNELRLEAYADDPEGLEIVKKRNLDTYGNEWGPTQDSLYEKYGSWEMVLIKALGSNPGMDACLGFYDEYYELYDFETESDAENQSTQLADAGEKDDANAFSQWNADAPALNTLIDYVEAVTDESSPDYIPEEDRIAVFDMDGTLMGELYPTYLEYYMLAWRILKDPTFTPDAEMLAVGRTLRDCALDNSFPADMTMQHAIQAARAYAGMTLHEFEDFVTQILVRDVDGFEGMTYASCFYLPMVEVVEYLQDNGFTCYVVSGSDRFICRVVIEGMLDIPYNNVIGMDVQLETTEQGDDAALDHTFSIGEDVRRTDQLLIKNLKTNKVLQIAQEIGQRPVLSFGNSSGDTSMHNYVIGNNPYRSAAFMLVADDDVRDYGNPEKAAELKEKWEAAGYQVVSMANDWKTIYGENVVKTGEFHWLEELAEDRIPSDAAREEQAEEDIQYVMYLGTNDKDTNKPVFTQEEAKDKAREILIRHFSGYTLQEANGGWVDDDGTVYQEYTLVIYLSGATENQVHAAADELIQLFNQSSVLIQANPTRTEFYPAI